ncbi:MAG: CPBP family intramembrane metalloprotease [Candidatus Marinimicrobia bacterium]|nr:CPBP family intramembrane metalloprotease [Candidatus Neomarinimicrobiota bacterium]
MVVYEAGTIWLFSNQPYELRNAADALLRFILEQIGAQPGYYFSIIFASALVITLGLGVWREERRYHLNSVIFPMMLVESLIWGMGLYLILQQMAQLVLGMTATRGWLVQVNLAVGAGLYEEMIFRVILIAVLGFIFQSGFRWKYSASGWASLLGAAVIFAGFHLFTETFVWSVFIQRFTGGVLLGILYLKRGYGITVYSHIFYNLMILFLP